MISVLGEHVIAYTSCTQNSLQEPRFSLHTFHPAKNTNRKRCLVSRDLCSKWPRIEDHAVVQKSRISKHKWVPGSASHSMGQARAREIPRAITLTPPTGCDGTGLLYCSKCGYVSIRVQWVVAKFVSRIPGMSWQHMVQEGSNLSSTKHTNHCQCRTPPEKTAQSSWSVSAADLCPVSK